MNLSKTILSSVIVAGVAMGSAFAEEGKELSMAEAAKKSANPVSDVWMLIAQNDYTALEKEDGHHEMRNRLSLQPVMPVPIMDGEYNLVNRVVLPYYSSPGSDALSDFGSIEGFTNDRTSGLGDTVLMSLVAPNRDDGLIWGVGPTLIAPTATEDTLGQEKWQAGPAALVARMGSDSGDITSLDSWNVGMLAQHWWSFSGDDDRADTSQSDIQYFLNYKVDAVGLIGMTPNIQIDWEREGKDRFTVPVGLGYIGVMRIGQIPVRWGIEAQYYIMKPDANSTEEFNSNPANSVAYAPDFNVKVFFAPIISNPFK
ncbi:hypothetical protein [Vibrio sp. Vb339]|uniref:hypothetical protein n=1 Tax=Vibrio sp. Vb339 TaxID=1192013 RepID=UPI001557BB7B|nr:hypothetical protein [Vibrio sp. Vb339]